LLSPIAHLLNDTLVVFEDLMEMLGLSGAPPSLCIRRSFKHLPNLVVQVLETCLIILGMNSSAPINNIRLLLIHRVFAILLKTQCIDSSTLRGNKQIISTSTANFLSQTRLSHKLLEAFGLSRLTDFVQSNVDDNGPARPPLIIPTWLFQLLAPNASIPHSAPNAFGAKFIPFGVSSPPLEIGRLEWLSFLLGDRITGNLLLDHLLLYPGQLLFALSHDCKYSNNFHGQAPATNANRVDEIFVEDGKASYSATVGENFPSRSPAAIGVDSGGVDRRAKRRREIDNDQVTDDDGTLPQAKREKTIKASSGTDRKVSLAEPEHSEFDNNFESKPNLFWCTSCNHTMEDSCCLVHGPCEPLSSCLLDILELQERTVCVIDALQLLLSAGKAEGELTRQWFERSLTDDHVRIWAALLKLLSRSSLTSFSVGTVGSNNCTVAQKLFFRCHKELVCKLSDCLRSWPPLLLERVGKTFLGTLLDDVPIIEHGENNQGGEHKQGCDMPVWDFGMPGNILVVLDEMASSISLSRRERASSNLSFAQPPSQTKFQVFGTVVKADISFFTLFWRAFAAGFFDYSSRTWKQPRRQQQENRYLPYMYRDELFAMRIFQLSSLAERTEAVHCFLNSLIGSDPAGQSDFVSQERGDLMQAGLWILIRYMQLAFADQVVGCIDLCGVRFAQICSSFNFQSSGFLNVDPNIFSPAELSGLCLDELQENWRSDDWKSSDLSNSNAPNDNAATGTPSLQSSDVLARKAFVLFEKFLLPLFYEAKLEASSRAPNTFSDASVAPLRFSSTLELSLSQSSSFVDALHSHSTLSYAKAFQMLSEHLYTTANRICVAYQGSDSAGAPAQDGLPGISVRHESSATPIQYCLMHLVSTFHALSDILINMPVALTDQSERLCLSSLDALDFSSPLSYHNVKVFLAGLVCPALQSYFCDRRVFVDAPSSLVKILNLATGFLEGLCGCSLVSDSAKSPLFWVNASISLVLAALLEYVRVPQELVASKISQNRFLIELSSNLSRLVCVFKRLLDFEWESIHQPVVELIGAGMFDDVTSSGKFPSGNIGIRPSCDQACDQASLQVHQRLKQIALECLRWKVDEPDKDVFSELLSSLTLKVSKVQLGQQIDQFCTIGWKLAFPSGSPSKSTPTRASLAPKSGSSALMILCIASFPAQFHSHFPGLSVNDFMILEAKGPVKMENEQFAKPKQTTSNMLYADSGKAKITEKKDKVRDIDDRFMCWSEESRSPDGKVELDNESQASKPIFDHVLSQREGEDNLRLFIEPKVGSAAALVSDKKQNVDRHVPCCPGKNGCPGKPLQSFTTPNQGLFCDACGINQPQSVTMHGCRDCNFDLCVRCLAAIPESPLLPTSNISVALAAGTNSSLGAAGSSSADLSKSPAAVSTLPVLSAKTDVYNQNFEYSAKSVEILHGRSRRPKFELESLKSILIETLNQYFTLFLNCDSDDSLFVSNFLDTESINSPIFPDQKTVYNTIIHLWGNRFYAFALDRSSLMKESAWLPGQYQDVGTSILASFKQSILLESLDLLVCGSTSTEAPSVARLTPGQTRFLCSISVNCLKTLCRAWEQTAGASIRLLMFSSDSHCRLEKSESRSPACISQVVMSSLGSNTASVDIVVPRNKRRASSPAQDSQPKLKDRKVSNDSSEFLPEPSISHWKSDSNTGLLRDSNTFSLVDRYPVAVEVINKLLFASIHLPCIDNGPHSTVSSRIAAHVLHYLEFLLRFPSSILSNDENFPVCAPSATPLPCLSMQIFVQIFMSKTITLDTKSSDSIEKVKQKIFHMEGILPAQQRLAYNWNQLADGLSLADYEIQNGSMLDLLLIDQELYNHEVPQPPSMTFHVSELAPSISSIEIAAAFRRLNCPVSEVIVKRDPLTKLSRGYGFLTLQRPEYASALLFRMKQDPAFVTQILARDPVFLNKGDTFAIKPAITNGDGSSMNLTPLPVYSFEETSDDRTILVTCRIQLNMFTAVRFDILVDQKTTIGSLKQQASKCLSEKAVKAGLHVNEATYAGLPLIFIGEWHV
jgi:hypothetical protein